MTIPLIEVVRGGVVESRHRVAVSVSDDAGPVAHVGPDAEWVFLRSAAKPMQALPLVEEGVVERGGLTQAELALCCASHEGEPEHVSGARSILAKAGADESLLECGPHLPFSPDATRAVLSDGGAPERVHNNCSGKHAGMVALAVAMGWDPAGYHAYDHPVQRRMAAEMTRWSGLPESEIPTGVDGCGIVCFAMALPVMATVFARFASAARDGETSGRVVDAMTSHPFMVGGTGRACTDVMAQAGGRAFVKLGAEGVYGGGVPDLGLGFSIKVMDGGRRAVEVALVHTLAALGVLDDADVTALAKHGRPPVLNTRDEVVGEVRPAFDLALP